MKKDILLILFAAGILSACDIPMTREEKESFCAEEMANWLLTEPILYSNKTDRSNINNDNEYLVLGYYACLERTIMKGAEPGPF